MWRRKENATIDFFQQNILLSLCHLNVIDNADNVFFRISSNRVFITQRYLVCDRLFSFISHALTD